MIQLTVTIEAESRKRIIEELQKIILEINSGSDGDFDETVSWWLENNGED